MTASGTSFPSLSDVVREGDRWVLSVDSLGMSLVAGDDRSVAIRVHGEEIVPDQVHLIGALGGDEPWWKVLLDLLEAWARYGQGIGPQDGLVYAASSMGRRQRKFTGPLWWSVAARDASMSVRGDVARALTADADPEVFMALAKDPEPTVQMAVGRNVALPREVLLWLSLHGGRNVVGVIGRDSMDALAVTNAMQTLGPDAVPVFRDRRKDTISVSMWQGMALQGHRDLIESILCCREVPTLVLRRIATSGRYSDLVERAQLRVADRDEPVQRVGPRRRSTARTAP